ncbi:MAG: Trm112 family protein [Deltaproteobacteria bacterium]|nr:Trm112 family protein [Deltaproteobacteria bacterium]
MPITPELKAILACPKCKGPLAEHKDPEGFACEACKLLYKVEDEIPNFLIDEAVPLK